MHSAFVPSPACPSPPYTQLSPLLWEGIRQQSFPKQLSGLFVCLFFFPKAVPHCLPGQPGCQTPSPMATHGELHSRSRCEGEEQRAVCAALPLLSEVPITQGQAEARAKPARSVGIQPSQQPVSVTSKTAGKKDKNKNSSPQNLPRDNDLLQFWKEIHLLLYSRPL